MAFKISLSLSPVNYRKHALIKIAKLKDVNINMWLTLSQIAFQKWWNNLPSHKQSMKPPASPKQVL